MNARAILDKNMNQANVLCEKQLFSPAVGELM